MVHLLVAVQKENIYTDLKIIDINVVVAPKRVFRIEIIHVESSLHHDWQVGVIIY